jgi:CRISPR system Cascade subunit CasD
VRDPVLCLRLFGPLASWGSPEAGAADRPTSRHPSRGAILGLAAAALGIARDDADGLDAVGRSLLVAAASHGARRVVGEFRTVQTVESRPKQPFWTRAQALDEGPVHTMVTTRSHVEDGLWRVFVACGPEGSIDLERLCQAFRRPVFELYLGRREFPLALPPDPVILAGGLAAALNGYPAVPTEGRYRLGAVGDAHWAIVRLVGTGPYEAVWDQGFPGAPPATTRREIIDDPFSRPAWRFRPRVECGAWIQATKPAPTDLHDEFFERT